MPDYPARRAGLLGSAAPGPGARRALAQLTDEWLAELYAGSGAAAIGASLVAVGGYGRGTLSPGSDLDLLLLHPPGAAVAPVAEALWYPIWDAGIALDHSVRDPATARHVAAADVRALFGMLDARTVAGPAEPVLELRSRVLQDFRATADQRARQIREQVGQRRERSGDLAHLLEPDLKEAYGGLRDVTVLRSLAAASLTDVNRAVLDGAEQVLLDVRDALHRSYGWCSPDARRHRGPGSADRLIMQQQQDVAALLGLTDPDGAGDADAVLRLVLGTGRTVAYQSDLAWRRAVGPVSMTAPAAVAAPGSRLRRVRLGRVDDGSRTPLSEGVVAAGDEVRLARRARLSDPVLPLRAAAAAARTGRMIPEATLQLLAVQPARLPEPWPESARRAFAALLGAGPAMLGVWEGLDQAGLIVQWIPEWAPVRSAPQRNPVHQFTVDRHLVQTAARAAALTREVNRPDLLLVGAVLHDIGKSRGGDHTRIGEQIVADLAPRMGFDAADSATLVWLVHAHLLLPDAASRRDLDDPATIEAVAAEARTGERLALLHALTIADAQATGPLAWTPWKAGLVAELVARVDRELSGGLARSAPEGVGELAAVLPTAGRGTGFELRAVPGAPGSGVVTLEVVAEDRPGLLGEVAGVLAMHRLEVLAADTRTVGGSALLRWRVQPLFGDLPDLELMRQDIRRALSGSLDPDDVLRQRERGITAAAAMPAGSAAATRVRFMPGASDRATVLQVHASDRLGLLQRMARSIAATGAVITSARVDTFGADAVNVFYLTSRAGHPLTESEQEVVRAAVLSAAQD